MALKIEATKHINVDVVVIGGGMVGLTLALSLGSAGLSVALQLIHGELSSSQGRGPECRLPGRADDSS